MKAQLVFFHSSSTVASNSGWSRPSPVPVILCKPHFLISKMGIQILSLFMSKDCYKNNVKGNPSLGKRQRKDINMQWSHPVCRAVEFSYLQWLISSSARKIRTLRGESLSRTSPLGSPRVWIPTEVDLVPKSLVLCFIACFCTSRCHGYKKNPLALITQISLVLQSSNLCLTGVGMYCLTGHRKVKASDLPPGKVAIVGQDTSPLSPLRYPLTGSDRPDTITYEWH